MSINHSPRPFLKSAMQSTNASNSFAIYSYYFHPFDNGGDTDALESDSFIAPANQSHLGGSVPDSFPVDTPDPWHTSFPPQAANQGNHLEGVESVPYSFPVETPDPSWFYTSFPSANQGSHLDGCSVPDPCPPIYAAETFESSWFEEGSSLLPSGRDILHSPGPFHNQPAPFPPFPTASASESTGSAVSPFTPRRVQNGERKNEARRIQSLQNDEYVASFTEARVVCACCQKSIKLDTRYGARFYEGSWLMHRRRCKDVKR
jgi:hypothetical protein